MSLSLLEYCRVAKVTVSDVARDAGLDPKWLYKVAKGERGFSPKTAAKIEAATSGAVTPSDLTKARMDWLALNPDEKGAGKKSAGRPFVVAADEAA